MNESYEAKRFRLRHKFWTNRIDKSTRYDSELWYFKDVLDSHRSGYLKASCGIWVDSNINMPSSLRYVKNDYDLAAVYFNCDRIRNGLLHAKSIDWYQVVLREKQAVIDYEEQIEQEYQEHRKTFNSMSQQEFHDWLEAELAKPPTVTYYGKKNRKRRERQPKVEAEIRRREQVEHERFMAAKTSRTVTKTNGKGKRTNTKEKTVRTAKTTEKRGTVNEQISLF